MVKDLKQYERYAELKAIVAEAEAEMKTINTEIVKELHALDVDEFPTDFGTFVLSRRKKWTYPNSVLLLETSFKNAKTEAEQVGTAEYVEQVELRFNKLKGEEV